jgi:D-alanyl-D-alanine dipeptidase
MRFPPIPEFELSIKGWKNIPIEECGERLVSIGEAFPEQLVDLRPQYYLQGISGALPECYVRETVVERLVDVACHLPDGLRLVIWDAWRPLKVQQALFDDYKTELRNQYPDMDEDRLIEETSTFVSLPSDNPLFPSPHSTGGAIDLSIVDDGGEYLKMGTAFDDFSLRANTRYYEEKLEAGSITPPEEEFLQNRRLLFHVMTRGGFTNYPEEWWHFDYGDQFWAKLSGNRVALYGRKTVRSVQFSG